MKAISIDHERPDQTWESARKKGPLRRLRLRRADGRVYLDRWGIAPDRIGGVLLHRMQAPDPGLDLHDHPWWFVSIVLWGGYREQRWDARLAPQLAAHGIYPVEEERRVGSIRSMRLDECHTVRELRRRTSWSLVIRGPRRRRWGFYLPTGWMSEAQYDETVRAGRRDLWGDVGASGERPW